MSSPASYNGQVARVRTRKPPRDARASGRRARLWAAGPIIAMACGCGGGRVIGDSHRIGRDAGATGPAQAATAPAPAATPFTWTPTAFDAPCTASGCGAPYRLVIDFDSEAELDAVGWRRTTGSKASAHFARGVWTAPAGTYDEWLHGPAPWGRVATRLGGWAITARVEIRPGTPGCTPNTRGPGLRVSGDLGAFEVALVPGAGGTTASLTPGTWHTVRIEGRERGVSVTLDGKPFAAGGASPPGYSAPSDIEFGQLGCTGIESRWDRLVVEANQEPCDGCRPGEHPLIAALRRLVPDHAVQSGNTATAYASCLAHAAIDRAVRTVLVDDLARAGQPDRAQALARLAPLADPSAVDRAARALRSMGVPTPMPVCDPVRSADECNRTPPPAPAQVPPLVDFARRQFPHSGWTDLAASGAEAMFFAAVTIHERAGPDALAALLDQLIALAGPGGTCAARP